MTSAPPAIKILVTGSAMGSVGPLFDKLLTIHNKHGPFDFALCIGDFFGPSSGGSDPSDIERLLAGQLRAPIPCYITQGEYPLPEAVIGQFSKTNGELCSNVFLLSKSAVLTTADGLRIACIGGTYNPAVYAGSEIPHGFSSPYFTSQTLSKLLSNTISPRIPGASSLSSIASSFASSPLIDVLVAHDWPSVITNFSTTPLPSAELSNIGSPPINDVIEKTKPKYIFCSGGGKPPSFWEREPFTWADETDRVSRFIGLGAFGGEKVDGKKQRWFYAFVITPQAHTTTAPQRPANATTNPFTDIPRVDKRPFDAAEGENFRWGSVQRPWKRNHKEEGRSNPPPGYRCKRCDGIDHFINDCPERARPPQDYICKICNNGGHFLRDCPTKHAVGDTGGRKPREGYVCRACGSELHYIEDCPVVKGRRAPDKHRGVPRASLGRTNAVGGECYLTFPKGQLVPTHNAGRYDNEDVPKVPGGGHVLIVPIAHFATLDTIPEELRTSIVNECNRYQAALRALYAKNGAAAVFFEVGRVSSKGGHAHIQAVPSAFLDEGKLQGIEFDVEEEAGARSSDHGGGYFRVELPNGRKLVHRMRSGVPFSVQFGRNVLASLLKMEDRADWKSCLQSEEEDKADVQAFKAVFAPFDPLR
ncbi:CwfJ C-terminus 2-domain-containing protein-like protein [Russula brevipes]|nr:CwfJ C-terminus 2-domain-containing protein-like protein [Russula brevipes]